MNLIRYAVPFFFVAIAAEILLARARRRSVYRFAPAISDLDAGIASQVADAFLKAIGLSAYAALYEHRFVHFDEGSPWPWIIGLLGIDFLYYWWHRASHVVNVLWAVHAVHHQSEELNLAVALRQPAFEAITIIPFHVPLSLLGVPPSVYIACYAIDLIYQFGIHTELVRNLGIIEKVLNTPSSHRVHHGINPQYLDKNYGGILIVWDRLFGSYEPEGEPPVYGVTHPLASYNPAWANWAPIGDIVRKARDATSTLGRLRVWIAHPGSMGGAAREPLPVSRATFHKYDPPLGRNVAGYVFAHFIVLLAAGSSFMSLAEHAGPGELFAPAIVIVASAVVLGGYIEGKRWALPLDLARHAASLGLLSAYVCDRFGAATGLAAAAAALALAIGLFVWFRPAAGLSRAAL